MEKLSWYQITDIIGEYEAQHNYRELKAFCDKYFPTATKVKVAAINEYNDNYYYMTFDKGSTSFFHDETELYLANNEVDFLLLLAASPWLRLELEEDKPEDPIEWLKEMYDGDFCELDLCGPERADDLEVDLTTPPDEPTPLYRLTKGDTDALGSDAEMLRV